MSEGSSSTMPAPPDTETGVPTVLIVDDEKLGAEHVKGLVAAFGCRVMLANTWSEALEVFSRCEIDLVLMDAVMPNVDGFKLTRILRRQARSYVPIVFLTGLTDQQVRRRCVEAGADDLLAKPVDELELQTRLTAMLRIRRLTRELETKTRALEHLAKVDGLTGLLNRRTLDSTLPQEIDRARRYGRELSLLMLDIDHFKQVNDQFGHDAGDQVLRCIGAVLRRGVRGADQAYRYGGEELVVIAPETSASASVELASRIREAFQKDSTDASIAGAQTVSIGIASLSMLNPQDSFSELQAAADEALYQAKREGRNRACLYPGHANRVGATVMTQPVPPAVTEPAPANDSAPPPPLKSGKTT